MDAAHAHLPFWRGAASLRLLIWSGDTPMQKERSCNDSVLLKMGHSDGNPWCQFAKLVVWKQPLAAPVCRWFGAHQGLGVPSMCSEPIPT